VFDAKQIAELRLFSGRTIDVPLVFIAGKNDWGPYQTPGALETMKSKARIRMLGVKWVERAGHWVQQEHPQEVTQLLVEFLREQALRSNPGDATTLLTRRE
jgi:pimeloyl-ACP methyl ester carboxylesterase